MKTKPFGPRSREPSIDVAIVSWNTRELLAQALRAFEHPSDDVSYSVWVVDNGSTDGSRELVRDQFAWARLIEPDENMGFGAAVNLVAERTTATWLLAANADVAPEPSAIERLISRAEETSSVGVIAPRLVLPGGSTQHSVHAFPGVGLAVAVNLGLTKVAPGLAERLAIEGAWDPERPREVPWAHGAFLLFRRRAFEAVGGFDRSQWMYAEDLDICWRLREAGWKTFYEPSARVRHEHGAATRQAFGDERLDKYMAASYAWMIERRGAPVTWAYATVGVLGSGIRFLFLSVTSRFKPSLWRQRERARGYLRVHARGLRAPSSLKRGAPQVH